MVLSGIEWHTIGTKDNKQWYWLYNVYCNLQAVFAACIPFNKIVGCLLFAAIGCSRAPHLKATSLTVKQATNKVGGRHSTEEVFALLSSHPAALGSILGITKEF